MHPSTRTRRRARFALLGTGALAAHLALAAGASPAGAATPITATFRAGVLTIDGTSSADAITLSTDGFGRITLNGAAMPVSGAAPTLGTTALISIDAKGGADTYRVVDTIAGALPRTEVIGGAGADTFEGGRGVELLAGGAGTDTLDAGPGDDTLQGGDAADTLVWQPGDGSDTVDGGAGTDRLRLLGANVDEAITLAGQASGAVRLQRDVASVVQVIDDVEALALHVQGGGDTVSAQDLAGTDLRALDLELNQGAPTTPMPDGKPDRLTVIASDAAETVTLHGGTSPRPVPASGLDIGVLGAGDATDGVTVDVRDGADVLDASALPADRARLTVLGGSGDDRLTGHDGVDDLGGGPGVDVIATAAGADRADGGADGDTISTGTGDDRVFAHASGGLDRIDGGSGQDAIQLPGGVAADHIAAAPVGDRLRMDFNARQVVDAAGMESATVIPLGGADIVALQDVAAAGVSRVDVDLTVERAGDGAADTVTRAGTATADSLLLTGKAAGAYAVTGTGTDVEVVGSEPTRDAVSITAGNGDDAVRASGTVPAAVTVDGAAGHDTIGGSPGSDVLRGGDGQDTITSTGTSGVDQVDGGTGIDRYVAAGTNATEAFTVMAMGDRTKVLRDQGGNGTLKDVEGVEVRPGRGRDVVRIESLAGTPTRDVRVAAELVEGVNAGDREVDRIEVVGTAAADDVRVSARAGMSGIFGLAAEVQLFGLDATDELRLITGGGADEVEAGFAAGVLRATFDLGGGHDVVGASNGDDTILGGAGDDRMSARAGRDTVDGGTGTDRAFDAEVVTNVP